jgi:mannosyltransferase
MQSGKAGMPTQVDVAEISVIVPNFKRRLSGVTATIVRLVPIQSSMIGLATVGAGLPDTLPRLTIARLVVMPRTRPDGGARVWHARRNTEMIGGLALKWLLGKRLRLLFTSASQRRHTRLTKWLIARMDAVIATSGRTAEYLERPATVILHGIDTGQFHPLSPDEKVALRQGLGLPENARLVGCYGRIRRQKGTDVFVAAMKTLCARHPDLVALVMGRATEKHQVFEKELKTQIAAAGLAERIRFLPEVPVGEMARWYQALDLFVAPQRWEGFGLTPLEAMACGVPVVATTVGAFPELVADGVTGALIEPGDTGAMVDAVSPWLDAPERLSQGAQAARARASEHFDIANEARAIVDVYTDLLNGSPS